MAKKKAAKKYEPRVITVPDFVLRHPRDPLVYEEYYFMNIGDVFPDFYNGNGFVSTETATCMVSLHDVDDSRTTTAHEVYSPEMWRRVTLRLWRGWKFDAHVPVEKVEEGEKPVVLEYSLPVNARPSAVIHGDVLEYTAGIRTQVGTVTQIRVHRTPDDKVQSYAFDLLRRSGGEDTLVVVPTARVTILDMADKTNPARSRNYAKNRAAFGIETV